MCNTVHAALCCKNYKCKCECIDKMNRFFEKEDLSFHEKQKQRLEMMHFINSVIKEDLAAHPEKYGAPEGLVFNYRDDENKEPKN